MQVFILKGCEKCGGDLGRGDNPEEDEWKCMQCGRYYYPKGNDPILPLPVVSRKSKGGRPKGWADEEEWVRKYRDIISLLLENNPPSLREIARATGYGTKRVEQVKRHLRDLDGVLPIETLQKLLGQR